jgi:hypothetical protein
MRGDRMVEPTTDTPEEIKDVTVDKKYVFTTKVIPSPAKVYTSNLGRSRVPNMEWEPPEWDLAETGRIVDTESFVKRAFKVKQNLFLKEGYEFTSSDPKRAEYIDNRFRQMEFATGKPFPILMTETIASLIRCSNAFWVKVRDIKASGGKPRQIGRREIEPIAGYFLLPAETVRFKRDEYGKVKKYMQDVWGHETKEFKPEDVIHFYFNRREGYSVGTPDLTPVKDDIRALRRIEENIELLIYQHLFPLFHYKVGTPEAPAQVYPDGTDEVQKVMLTVAEMPSDGCWVTPERHEVKAIGAESPPIAVENVIAYFKQRIYTGLGVSPIDMGEGGTANRSTAQTLSRNLIDDTKACQQEFGAQFFTFVLSELLMESTFDEKTIFDKENIVKLKFKEIDFEARQAKENHLTDIFLKNAITHDELRISMGMKPFQGEGWPTGTSKRQMFSKGDGDWARTNYGLVERDKVILQSLDEPGTPTSQAESQARTKATRSKSAGGNAVSNKNKPTNQHGTRSSTKTNKDSNNLAVFSLQKQRFNNEYEDIKNNLIIRIRNNGIEERIIKANLDLAFHDSTTKLINSCQHAYRAGLAETGHYIWEVQAQHIDAKILLHVTKYTTKLKDELLINIKKHTTNEKDNRQEDAVFVQLIFDSLQYRAKMIGDSEIQRAYNYGLASGYRLSGFEEMESIYTGNGSCPICKEHFLKIKSSDAIIYEELPPLHPLCKCLMRITKP